ncbi:NERD domain-containing protein [Roseateles sp. BYS87W]|uniref:DNA 3'-5' helicase II n=1 Tax=Pelomonas baiyunensis TaxID=3299026 RepID=A0ABW7H2S3_9BURK
MASVLPDLPRQRPLNAGEYAERQLLERLAEELPDAITLFHGVQIGQSMPMPAFGELDLVLVDPAGDLLVIEVKSGSLEVEQGRFYKQYGHQRKDVLQQARRQLQGLRQRLSGEGLNVTVHHVLVLPDVKVISGTVAWPKEWILDADAQPDLSRRLMDLMHPAGAMPAPNPELESRVLDFMRDRFLVALDVSARTKNVRTVTQRLAEGLATWVPRLQVPSGLLRVQATAGSGKTQLALRLLQDACRQGQRAAYLCFNRPLAEHMARIAPVNCQVETFHELAVRRHRQQLGQSEWQPVGSIDFDAAVATLLAQLETSAPDLDLLVLDEAQDFRPEWVLAALQRLHTQGQAVLLEDADQALYADRETFDLPEAAVLRSPDNFRSPRAIVDLINLLQLSETRVEGRGVEMGEPPDPLVYDGPRQLIRQTELAVRRCLEKGYALSDIVILSFRGRASSALHEIEKLGEWSVQRPTDQFDADGSMKWTSGEVMLDTVFRFKGQAAPAVVLTECDFESLDVVARRRLFVGMTRAQRHLEWVISQQAAKALAALLE